jgi:cellulose synthase/poly-beta-1,6-N-acetylglucosamine synthase-like glycosyltransferase
MAGVSATSAPYVLALDADDMIAPGSLTALADALDADPGAAAAWGDTEMFGDANVHVPKARALDPWQITYVNLVPTSSLIRRDALVAAGGWQLEAGYEDWDLWMALAERGLRGVHVPRTVVRHRLHGERRWSRDFDRHVAIEDELRRRHPKLFAQRPRNWRGSRAPWRSRLLFPVLYRVPLPPAQRFRLAIVLSNPIAVPRLWLQARRARARS